MELSCTKYKWTNSMDYSLFKYLIMDQQERSNKIKELSSIIVDLKSNRSIDSQKTIQKLQQQIDELINE